MFEPDHPEVLAAQLALAVELSAAGDPRAMEKAEDVTRRLATVMGDAHPFVGAAIADRALVAMRCGDLEGALSLGAEADEVLAEAVDDVHPWRIAVASNRVRALALAGRERDAGALLDDTVELSVEYLDFDRERAGRRAGAELHPVAEAVAHNRVVTERDGVVAAANGHWRDLDIDVPSV